MVLGKGIEEQDKIMRQPWFKWAVLAGGLGVFLCLVVTVGLGLLLSQGSKQPAQSKESYTIQVAVVYSQDSDLESARVALDALDVPNTRQWLAGLIDRYLAEGGDPAELRALVELAHGLGVNSPQVVAYVASLTPAPTDTAVSTITPFPTDTPLPAPSTTPIPPTETPTLTPAAPILSPTPQPQPTDTAAPPTVTPSPTSVPTNTPIPPTPRPTATPTPSVLFEDHFEDGAGKWTPYLHLGRLDAGQWYWDARAGYGDSGGYAFHHSAHGTSKKNAEDAITMVLVPGAEEWTDYRARLKFNAHSGKKVGLWFRGNFEESKNKGQWFEGYYCQAVVRDDDKDRVQFFTMRTYDEPGSPPPEKDEYYYHFTNPHELAKVSLNQDLQHGQWYEMVVEVRGPHIKCYVGDELVVDYTDTVGSVFLKGSVGIALYGSEESEGVMSFDDVIVEPLR